VNTLPRRFTKPPSWSAKLELTSLLKKLANMRLKS
jgi:hypothetical protein